MIEIKELLLKFRNTLLSEEDRKKTIIEIIKKTTNLQLKKESLKIKNGILYLNIKPIYKNEIFIKQNEILFELKKILNKKAPLEIR